MVLGQQSIISMCLAGRWKIGKPFENKLLILKNVLQVVLLIRAAAGPVESLQPRTNRDCVNDESVAVDKISDATSEGVQQNPDNYSPVGETERCTNDNGPFKSRDWYAPSPQDRKVSNNLCRCFVLLPIGITHMSILYVVAFGRGMQIAQHEIVDRLRSAVVPED